MYLIVAPLTTGQFGPDVRNLQDVLLYLLETGILNNENTPISVSGLNNEREQSFFGDFTRQFVTAFKTQYFLSSGPNELVNTPIADLMNSFADPQMPPRPVTFTFRGIVTHTSGNLITTNYVLRIEQVLFGGNAVLATTEIGGDGTYVVTGDTSTFTASGSNWAFIAVVEVPSDADYPSAVQFVSINRREAEINVVLDTDITVESEYTTIKTKVEALIGATEIRDITYDVENAQVDFLAKSINESVRDVRFLIIAHQLNHQLNDLDSELFYGLLRNSIPEIPEQLLFQSVSSFENALENAMSTNTISTYTEMEIGDFIEALKPEIVIAWNTDNSSDLSKTITFRLYNSVLADTALTNGLIAEFYKFEDLGTSNDFWEYLKDDFVDYDSFIDDLKAISALGILSGNNPALASELLAILKGGTFSGSETLNIVPGKIQPELLARLTLANWIAVIDDVMNNDASNFLFPDFVIGEDDGEKIDFYAERMLANFTSIYTIQSLAAKLGEDLSTPFPVLKDNIETFLENNTGIDLKAISILALKADGDIPYDLDGITDLGDFIEEIATVQRLSAITSSYEVMSALATDGLKSAFHVTTKTKAEFVEDYGSVFGSDDKATKAYEMADSTTTEAVGKFYGKYVDASRDDYGPVTGPSSDGIPIGGADPVFPFPDPYADWRTLFGSLDSCSCCHCESIYSPSAYLVDTLNFIKKEGIYAWEDFLGFRRPDIKHIELTCDNSNIPVPYIDLVNELLEDLIGNGYSYARQTKSPAEYQKAIPEYINTSGYYDEPGHLINSPYPILKDSVYPWNLPYNFYKRQIDTYLSIPGVKGFELVQRFSPKDLISALSDLSFCMSYINIDTNTKNAIVTASSLTASIYKDLQVFYGMTIAKEPASSFRTYIPNPQLRGDKLTITESTWILQLTNRVDVFLQQTKLTYVDLLELLDCYYINPIEEEDVRQFEILNNASTTNITTCNLFELKIQPVEDSLLPAFMDRLHRFVRLSRALGWHYYELDIALRAVAGNTINEAGFKKLVHLKYLVDSLNIKVEEACILFQDVEILPYRDYRHEDDNCELIDIPDQYSRIFRSLAMTNANLANPFPPSDALTFSYVNFDVFRNFVAGVTQLTSSDLQLLLDQVYLRYTTIVGSTFLPSISSLSYIYRQAILIKALKISVKDWGFYNLWCSNSSYFGDLGGGSVNDLSAIPISILSPSTGSPYTALPYDAIRFVSYAKLFKNTGLKTSELEYILIDKPSDSIQDLNLNGALSEVLLTLRGDLLKKWYPSFDDSAEEASENLKKILSLVLDESQSSMLMSILNREPAVSPSYTTAEYDFIDIELAGIFPSDAADKLANPSFPDYIDVLAERYTYAYNVVKANIIDSTLKPLIVSALAKFLKIDEDSIQVLLNDIIVISGDTGFDLLLNEAFVFSSGDIDRWTSGFEDQFTVLLLLQKSALLISQFKLGTLDVQYLWAKKITGSSDPVIPNIIEILSLPIRPDIDTVFVPGTSSTPTLRLFRNLLQWMQVRAFLGKNINILFNAIEMDNAIVESLAAVFKINSDDIDALIVDPPSGTSDSGILDIDDTMYRTPLSYLRIIDCLEMQHLLPAPMNTLYNVATATKTADDQTDAAEVIHIVKAPFKDQQWLEIVKPVNDQLRIERRDAMISYLLAYPVYLYRYSWLTSNDIYETLLVDVEMMPIVTTTRILLAINTVQIWMSRVLLGLEKFTISSTGARQWTNWRKLYRVWEANRKVFIYPENWIEPELRDDKTPQFIELEKFLKQNEVTADTVESAYKTYLERLDQLSKLDIVAIFRETALGYQNSIPDPNMDVVHAFGRTREHPHLYYYRKRVMSEWSAWEKMDLQIDGDHFIPVMWRGRLRLYWLVFTKDTEEVPASAIQEEGSFELPAGVRWKIQLAWTEMKDNKWLAKQLSKEAVYTTFLYEESQLSADHFNAYKTTKWNEHRWWNKNGDLEKLKLEGINFFSEVNGNGDIEFTILERKFGFQNLDGIFSDLVRVDTTVTPTFKLYIADPEYPISVLLSLWKTHKDSGGKSGWPPGMVPDLIITKTSVGSIKTVEDVTREIYEQTEWGLGDVQVYKAGKFIVKFNDVTALNSQDAGEIPFKRSLYSHIPYDPDYTKIDLFHNGYWPENSDYWYRTPGVSKSTSDGYSHYPDSNLKLLNNGAGNFYIKTVDVAKLNDTDKATIYARGKKYWKNIVADKYKSKFLVFPRSMPEGYVDSSPIAIPYFFYKDNKNTFFVEKVTLPYDFRAAILPVGPFMAFGEVGPVLKVDGGSGTGISLGSGIGSIGTDIMEPEAGEVSWGSDVPMTAKRVMTKSAYRFHNFTHQQIEKFLNKIHLDGIDGLLSRDFIEGITDTFNFAGIYEPTTNVHDGIYYPNNKVDFSNEGAYSRYNWELFFHIPLLIANKLSQNQQFDEARKWYHYVFNPCVTHDTGSKKRFWNFVPFYDSLGTTETIDYVMKSSTLDSAVKKWSENPFKPHLIARTRLSAYMKNTVMKYLDNLISWGDNLFRSDSRESINEATLLYILALQILGRRPEKIPARSKPEVQTYATIYDKLDAFGNVMVDAENVLLSSGAKRHYKKVIYGEWISGVAGTTYVEFTTTAEFDLKGSMYLFCTPFNEKLLQYWDTLADRLFKIRNSQNIDGVTRELALYDPPIDPAILVKAAAAGVSLAGILGDLNAPLPTYRFNVIAQKATELASEVKSLGGQLLSALEKKDAEQISLLRSSQEIKVLESISDLKEKQIEESKTQWEALGQQLKSANQRLNHYKQLIDNGLLGKEQTQLSNLQDTVPLQIAQGVISSIGGTLGILPQLSGPMPKVEFGGQHLSMIMGAAATAIGTQISDLNTKGTMAGINAGYERRRQDWDLQYNTAKVEVAQINKQLIAAEIRFSMSETELKNHRIQMANAQEMEIAMRDKYTNEDLYDWMIGQVSYVYFQGYKLAYETAKKAERCFRYELNLDTSDYIQYGYWDSLKKGLLAGENLSYDIKRMEVSYLDKNKRQLELTKHVSLAALDPTALMKLRIDRTCEVQIPEWLFDMDYPGQHMRRIKSVSISIPCVAGPYTTISCKLSLQNSRYRKSPIVGGGSYNESPVLGDNRFTYIFGNIQSIATSNGQNDSGMFEMNFRDERYLPFEGCGAISTWRIDLPAAYAQFDYNTISDLIFHIKYTALDNGSLASSAQSYLGDILANTGDAADKGLYRLISLKQEFSNEWHQLVNGTSSFLVLDNLKSRLPYQIQDKTLSVTAITVIADKEFGAKITNSATIPVSGYSTATEDPADVWTTEILNDLPVNDSSLSGTLYLHPAPGNPDDPSSIKECWMIIHYTAV